MPSAYGALTETVGCRLVGPTPRTSTGFGYADGKTPTVYRLDATTCVPLKEHNLFCSGSTHVTRCRDLASVLVRAHNLFVHGRTQVIKHTLCTQRPSPALVFYYMQRKQWRLQCRKLKKSNVELYKLALNSVICL